MIDQLMGLISLYLVPLAWKVLGAIVLWVVGGRIIPLVVALLKRALVARKVDATLSSYVENGANVVLRALILITILGVLGIETTSFAALLAAVGIAIGAAWSGVLANFAAGIFLVALRPYKVGDMISGVGITGVVQDVGLLATTIDRDDNVRVFIGNNKLFSETIINYSANPYRYVLLTAQLAHGVPPQQAIDYLAKRLVTVEHVLATPAPSIGIQAFNEKGTLLWVTPCCDNKYYWQVYDNVNKVIVEMNATLGYAVPEQRVAVRNV